MHIELCDLCGKRIAAKAPGYQVGRGDRLSAFRLCNSCGKSLDSLVRKVEAEERKRRLRKA